jgi:mono/diheme cytochrome c family protein
MLTQFRRFLAIVAVALIVVTGLTACTPAIAPIQPPAHEAFDAAEVKRGAELAALGDCAVCHTERNGRPFAGGRGVQTPFGIIYATNITPDPATGIGQWPLTAFSRTMRDGIDREGRHLYPVLPYPHFIHATDADIAAMYAFLMTREPVRQTPRPNDLSFPFKWRPLLAVWDLMFLKPGEWRPDPARSPEWNRGAYLVEAIGHCGACHTPHNVLGAEQTSQTLKGGEAEGWYAPALQADRPARASTAQASWSTDALTTYLRTGLDGGHGAAAGPMTAVTRQLAIVPETDVRAIAVYVGTLMSPDTLAGVPPGSTGTPPDASSGTGARGSPSDANTPVAAIFDGACGTCHGPDAPMTRGGAPSLALSTAVRAPTSRNMVDVILLGLPWQEGNSGPYMPGYAGALTDQQVGALAAYVRARYSNLPAWTDVAAAIQSAKRQGGGT